MENLTKEDLRHLENLSDLSIGEDQEDKFLEKFEMVISKLDDLDKVDTNDVDESFVSGNTLRVIDGVENFENKKGIIDNVRHEVINNSIVIKTKLNN